MKLEEGLGCGENRDHIAELYLTNTEQILEALSNLEGVYHSDLLSYMKRSRLQG